MVKNKRTKGVAKMLKIAVIIAGVWALFHYGIAQTLLITGAFLMTSLAML